MTRAIYAACGKAFMVDDADYAAIALHKWHSGKNKYAYRNDGGTTVYMHREIVRAQGEQYVDHRDHDTQNNTRENLRVCTCSQNLANQRPRTGHFKGIYRKRNGWCAALGTKPKQIVIGTFETAEEAAIAYDIFARMTWGEFAYTNFPDERPMPMTRRQKEMATPRSCPICSVSITVNPLGVARIYCSNRCAKAAYRRSAA